MRDSASGEADGAVFAPQSVRGSNGPPRIVAAGLAIVLGSLVVIGLLPAGDPARDGVAVATDRATPRMTELVVSRRFGEPLPAPSSGDAPLMQLDVRADRRLVFVYGEVFSNRVKVVVVSLRDAAGETTDIRTVNIPGGSTAFRIGSVDRFDLLFERPESMIDGAITIQASGYDADDDRIESVTASAELAEP